MNITNSAWVVECVKNGNGAANKFKQGSWFKVIFTGTKADKSTASVEYYLADYRSEMSLSGPVSQTGLGLTFLLWARWFLLALVSMVQIRAMAI